MSDHRSTLRTACPVLASAIIGSGECGAIWLRSRENVVPVRAVSVTIDSPALFGQRRLLVDVVRAMQLSGIFGDHRALGILPWSLADAVAGVDGRRPVGGLGREISAPGSGAGASPLCQRLTVIVGARKTA